MKIFAPNTFQTPNDFVDHWLSKLGCAETKVLLVIFRKTFGWNKTRDRISLSQLQKLTGLTRKSVSRASKSLSQKGVVSREVQGKNGSQETYYELIVNEDSNNSDQYTKYTPTSILGIPTKPTSQKKKETTTKKKIVVCSLIKTLELSDKEKEQLAAYQFSDERLKLAIEFAKAEAIKKDLISTIVWHCKQKIPPQTKKQEVNPLEDLAEKYNAALLQAGHMEMHELNLKAIPKGYIHVILDGIRTTISLKSDEAFKDLCRLIKELE